MSAARIGVLLVGLGLARLTAAQSPPVELVEPRAGATLVAGAEAALEWRAAAPLPGAEEWEAFLSLNGGRSYAFRLTPHLDVALRRVSVRLPVLPTADARLLLRFGDERREVSVELPVRFAIVAPPSAPRVPAIRVSHFSPGEPARPGEPGVVGWIAGARSGARAVEMEQGESPVGARPSDTLAAESSAPLADSPPSPSTVDVPDSADRGRAAEPTLGRAGDAASPPDPLNPLDRTQRLNE